MSDPLPPEATSPPSPRRVQFTMRTFFVAAVWISAVFAIGKSLPEEAAAVCIALLVMVGLYAIYHFILQATSARIAMVVGTMAMAAGFILSLPFARGSFQVGAFAFPIYSIGWGSLFSVIVGTTRALVLCARRRKKRACYRFWQRGEVASDEKPPSEARPMALALAGAHFRWSSCILGLGLLAQFILTHVRGLPSDGPDGMMALGIMVALFAVLAGPATPLLIVILNRCHMTPFNTASVTLWLIFNLLGVPLYLGLGWFIGRMLDYLDDTRHIAEDLVSKPLSPVDNCVEGPPCADDGQAGRE